MLVTRSARRGQVIVTVVLTLGCALAGPGEARALPVFRLDASNVAALTLDGANRVSVWNNPHGANLTATGTARPTYNPSVAGLDHGAVVFNGVDQFMQGAVGNFINSANWSMHFIAKDTKGGATHPWAHDLGFGDPGKFSARSNATWAFRKLKTSPNTDVFFQTTEAKNTFNTRTIVGQSNGVTSSLHWDLQGVAGLPHSAITAPNDTLLNASVDFFLGKRNVVGSEGYSALHLAELVIFNDNIGANARRGVDSLLAEKWGMPAIAATAAQRHLGDLALNAVPLARYDFNSPSGDPLNLSSTDVHSPTVAGDVSLSGFTGSRSALGAPPSSMFFEGNNLSTLTLAAARTANDYLSFTVSPTALTDDMSFESLSFDFQRNTTDAVTHFAVYTDAGGDNFTTLLGSEAFSGPVGEANFLPYSITFLNHSFLQNVTTPTTFRLYFWGAKNLSNSNANDSRIDNLMVHGLATVVPEPSSLALLACGALGFVVLGRRTMRRRAGSVIHQEG